MSTPDILKHSAGLYTVYNHEQYLEASRLHWDEFGSKGIHSGIDQVKPPTQYPVVVTYHIKYDTAGDEPHYIWTSYMYSELTSSLLQSLRHAPAPAEKVSSRFSLVGPGQYLVSSVEGFRSAAAAFWAENGKVHNHIQKYVKGAPTRYPAYCAFVTEEDDDGVLCGVTANCIYVGTLAKAMERYVG